MNKNILKLAVLAAIAAVPSIAGASEWLAEADKPLATTTQSATIIQQATVISNVLAFRQSQMGPGARHAALDGQTGMAAGNAPSKFTVWGNISGSDVKNDYVNTRYDGTVDNYTFGMDTGLGAGMVAGVSLGYDKTSIAVRTAENLKGSGWSLMPYLSVAINETLSVDAALGYSQGDQDIRLSATETGNQGYNRTLAALNLNANHWMGDLQLSGKASYIHSEETRDAYRSTLAADYTETTNRLEQFRLGGQVGYWSNGVMPYVGITYINDLSRPALNATIVTAADIAATNDKDSWEAKVGVNFFSKGAVAGGIVYTSETGRDHTDNDSLMANLNYRF